MVYQIITATGFWNNAPNSSVCLLFTARRYARFGLCVYEYPLQAADAREYFLQPGPTRPLWAAC